MGKNEEIAMLNDSIKALHMQIQAKEAEVAAKETEIAALHPLHSTYTEYVIVCNDSPWKIVNKFYGVRGDWAEIAKKIAIDNQMWDNEKSMWKHMFPGQVIRIYNK